MKDSAYHRLGRVRMVTHAAILWEKTSFAFGPLILWIATISSLIFFEIPAILGPYAQTTIFYVFWSVAIYLLIKAIRAFQFPTHNQIDRRIEEKNGLKNNPLSTIGDTLSNPQKRNTRLLWQEQQTKLWQIIRNIKPAGPKPQWTKKDPYALRYAIGLLCVAGLISAGNAAGHRLSETLKTPALSFARAEHEEGHIWITPPAYTGLPQIALKSSHHGIIKIPENSIIKASLRGGFGRPILKMGRKNLSFKKTGADDYILEEKIANGQTLDIDQLYLRRAHWQYQLVRDLPPVITMSHPPQALEDGALRFSLKVKDDYGIRQLTMRMNLDPGIKNRPAGAPYEEGKLIVSPPHEEIEINPLYDLTFHSWAGLPVTISFDVKDGAGHTVSLPPIKVQLPERKFSHPVARQIIALRKALITDPRTPTEPIARGLEILMTRPFDFQDDHVAFLSLRAAASRLIWGKPSKESIASVITLLWDTALRIEEGDINVAHADLQDAKTALEKALADPAITPEEIARLTDDVRTAMNQYLMELQKTLYKKMAQGGQMLQMPDDVMKQLLSPGSIASLLDQMQLDMKDGNRQAAQNMLSKLGQMLDFLNPSMVQKLPPDIQMMGQAVNILQKIIEAQQALLDQTKQLLDGNDVSPEQKQQQEIRGALNQIINEATKRLPAVPEPLTLSDKDMGAALSDLEKKQAIAATGNQQKALDDLKAAKNQMAEQLAARLKQMTGISFGSTAMRFDPLGRPLGNGQGQFLPGSDVKIPEEVERKQAQEILELLRQRSGESSRPAMELEYYRRLLKQF